MDYDLMHERVISRLDKLITERFGSAGAVPLQEQIGVNSSFFSDLRRKKSRLPMDKLAAALEILGEHPANFFYEALREEGMKSYALPAQKVDPDGPGAAKTTEHPELDEYVDEVLRLADERVRELTDD